MQITLCCLGLGLMLIGQLTAEQSVEKALVGWLKSVGVISLATVLLGFVTAVILHGVVIEGNMNTIVYGVVCLAVLRAVWVRVDTTL